MLNMHNQDKVAEGCAKVVGIWFVQFLLLFPTALVLWLILSWFVLPLQQNQGVSFGQVFWSIIVLRFAAYWPRVLFRDADGA